MFLRKNSRSQKSFSRSNKRISFKSNCPIWLEIKFCVQQYAIRQIISITTSNDLFFVWASWNIIYYILYIILSMPLQYLHFFKMLQQHPLQWCEFLFLFMYCFNVLMMIWAWLCSIYLVTYSTATGVYHCYSLSLVFGTVISM